jgi:hypothetical protein
MGHSSLPLILETEGMFFFFRFGFESADVRLVVMANLEFLVPFQERAREGGGCNVVCRLVGAAGGGFAFFLPGLGGHCSQGISPNLGAPTTST